MPARSAFPTPIYLGAATRTPIGKFGGSLLSFSAPKLGALALKEAIERSGGEKNAPKAEFVYMGHARQAGTGPNPARQASLGAGLPESVPAVTVNQACASGMTAVFQALEKIATGRAQFIWAGGTESMSNTPYLLDGARFGYRLGHATVLDGMRRDGFFCPMADMLMGETVERFIAPDIPRADQDAFALASQSKAERAWESGHFKKETFEINLKTKKGEVSFWEDEHRRADSSLEALAKLKPVFNPKNGSVTAGNSSGITDGAAFLSVSKEKHSSSQVEVLDYETVALDPKMMGMGPVEANLRILKRQGLKVEDIDYYEINEAFAAQVLACQRELKIPEEKLNPNGGSIAIGHPIGCSGARITVTLIHQLLTQKGALGIASACVSGGQGVAILLRSI